MITILAIMMNISLQEYRDYVNTLHHDSDCILQVMPTINEEEFMPFDIDEDNIA